MENLVWISRSRLECVGLGLASAAALLLLDGRLGPVSVTLRRAVVSILLIALTALTLARRGRTRRAWSLTAVPAILVLLRAPNVGIGLAALIAQLGVLEVIAGTPPAIVFPSAGLGAACAAYMVVCATADLIPSVGLAAETVARLGSRYVGYTRGFESNLSFTALGGPGTCLAGLYLVSSWRHVGGIRRVIAAGAVPLAWFALLPVAVPAPATGPNESFARGAIHSLFWLGVAVVICTPVDFGRGASAATAPKPKSRSARQAPGSRSHQWRSAVASGAAAALAGACLAGTGYVGPAAGRSVRVLNEGGLDWDRPVFGRFGGFSGGMFGLLPVYCRAEGYDFDVIDHITQTPTGGEPSGPIREGASPIAAPKGQPGPVALLSPPPQAGSALTEPSKSGAAPPRKDPDARAPMPPQDALTAGDLRNTQILVLINCPRIWGERERRVIYDFVAHGGSLLVLGDHTDVFGLMRGLNSLLGPLGIRLRFDSAYEIREGWRGCQAAAPDSVAWGWDEENPGVAVGASLELSGSARPLLTGRYAFSDNGERENAAGSYLGNYRYDAAERLGDVVLVATTTYGRGRVVVWGDTSSFQGVAFHYADVVGPLFAWLARPAAWTERPPVRIAAALTLLAAIAWLWLTGCGARESAVIAAGLMVGLSLPWCLGQARREALITVSDDTIVIDRSHLPLTGHYTARVNPIDPLYTNLMRSGFRLAEMRHWNSATIERARGLAFVAPQQAFTAAEVQELMRAERRGAVVILAAGQPDSEGSRRLLEAHGLALAPRPLGTVTSADPTASRRERETHPRLLDAWPIVRSDGGDPVELPGVDILYRRGTDTVTLFRRMGKGGILIIADTRFFSDGNVEDISAFWPGNLAFIHNIFKRYLGADPDSVKPLFRSPEKPQ
jgi:hypothetical protein